MRFYDFVATKFFMRFAVCVTLLLVAAGFPGAAALELRVPSEFATIQEAVDSAAEGDTVLVAPGTYSRAWTRVLLRSAGTIEIVANVCIERPMVLASETGAATTFIQGLGRGPVIAVSNARGVVIEGFTITDGDVDEMVLDGGGGIYCELSDVEIRQNIIENNSAPFGAGIACFTGSSFWIHDNIIRNNSDCEFGGGVALLGGSNGTVEFNVIDGNRADVFGGGIIANEQSSVAVENNTIVDNYATSGSGIFCRDGAEVNASRNIIAMGSGRNAVYCDTLPIGGPCVIELYCNDFWNNSGDNTEGCLSGTSNRSSNPFFCSFERNDFTLCAFSPSLGNDDGCGRRGALPSACFNCPVDERRLSWGFLKALYKQ